MAPQKDSQELPVPVRDANDPAVIRGAQAQGAQPQAAPPAAAVQAANNNVNADVQELVDGVQEVQERAAENAAVMAQQQQEQAARIAAVEAAHLNLLARLDAQIAALQLNDIDA